MMLLTIDPKTHSCMDRMGRSLYYWHDGKLFLKRGYRIVQVMDKYASRRSLPARPSLVYLKEEAEDLKRHHFRWSRIYFIFQKVNQILEARRMNRVLPGRPSLVYLKKEAKRLKKAYRFKLCDPEIFNAIRLLKDWKNFTDEKILETKLTLTMAQWAIAIKYGFKSWAKLKEFVLQSRQRGANHA